MSNKNTPYTYDEVKNYIESFGYELLSKEYKNANGHLIIKCPKGHIYNTCTFSSFKNRNYRCPYCSGNMVIKEKSVGFLYSDIANIIVKDERNNLTWEDTYKIAPYTSTQYYFICPICNEKSTKKKTIKDVIKDGYSCEFCSDGISIPEKFMANVLKQLNIDFITQYSPIWIENKRYDFYVPSLNMIIETHGRQHYERSKGNWLSLNHQQSNDKYKEEIAKNNNIKEYIIIDCRYSKLDWLKENVEKSLVNILDMSNVNWILAWEESQKSLVFKACELWNNNLCIIDITNELKLSNTTIRDYLKCGTKINLCNYTTEEGIKRGHKRTTGKNNGSSKSVICLTTKEIFLTMKDAAEKYNIKSTGAIPACCKGYVMRKGKKERIKSIGKLPDGTPLVWRKIVWNHGKKYRIKK